jgi:small subunit ribosomal protein S4
MSRYRGPRFKLIRRLGILPGLTNKLVKKKKKTQNEKKTQYRIRLEEKQKLRFHYGISERQLLRYVRNARKSKGSTGQKLLQLLEMRLDNIVYRSGIAPTIPAARQLVNHGHIIVNDQIVDIPSYHCCINDNINSSEILKKSPQPDFSKKKIAKLPYHLRTNQSTITVNSTVDRKFVGVKVNELLIVEYYSRQA